MKKGVPAVPAPPHGTHQRYVSRYFKCRCDCCKEANRIYMADYRERVKNNGGINLRVNGRQIPVGGIAKHSTKDTNSYIGDTQDSRW